MNAALTRGSQDGQVQQVSALEENFYKHGDLKQLMGVNGITDKAKHKRDLLDRMQGTTLRQLQFFAPCEDTTANDGQQDAWNSASYAKQSCSLRAADLSALGWVSPDHQPRLHHLLSQNLCLTAAVVPLASTNIGRSARHATSMLRPNSADPGCPDLHGLSLPSTVTSTAAIDLSPPRPAGAATGNTKAQIQPESLVASQPSNHGGPAAAFSDSQKACCPRVGSCGTSGCAGQSNEGHCSGNDFQWLVPYVHAFVAAADSLAPSNEVLTPGLQGRTTLVGRRIAFVLSEDLQHADHEKVIARGVHMARVTKEAGVACKDVCLSGCNGPHAFFYVKLLEVASCRSKVSKLEVLVDLHEHSRLSSFEQLSELCNDTRSNAELNNAWLLLHTVFPAGASGIIDGKRKVNELQKPDARARLHRSKIRLKE
eukprot:353716-Chlamydomonas_euryale.AAC.7